MIDMYYTGVFLLVERQVKCSPSGHSDFSHVAQ